MSVTRYQEGTIEISPRTTGPNVWVYRWREPAEEGKKKRRYKSRIVGTVQQYPSIDDAKRANDNFRAQINAQEERIGQLTVRDAWGHFQQNELRESDRSTSVGSTKWSFFPLGLATLTATMRR